MNINRWCNWSKFNQEEIKTACTDFSFIEMSALLINQVRSQPDVLPNPPVDSRWFYVGCLR